jgi:hypothetical protein
MMSIENHDAMFAPLADDLVLTFETHGADVQVGP